MRHYLKNIVLSALYSAAISALNTFGAQGLLARFQQGANVDSILIPNAALFVPAGSAATSMLQPGDCQIRLRGTVYVDLRAQYSFQLDSSIPATLKLNGKEVLVSDGSGSARLSSPVRMNKGTNALEVSFQTVASRDTLIRVFWKNKSMPLPIPIPPAALKFDEQDDVLIEHGAIRKGAILATEYRCIRCHTTELRGWPELEIDAPDLTQVGGRLRREWLVDWIAAPAHQRKNVHMPRQVERDDAIAIAEFISSTGSPEERDLLGTPAAGEKLFTSLRCVNCHGENAPDGIPLTHVIRKYQPGSLQGFLLNPAMHYGSIRMGNFKLSAQEAADLAEFLGVNPSRSEKGKANPRGSELLQTTGCLQCHKSTLQSKSSAKPLSEIAGKVANGCLNPSDTNTPRFELQDADRSALSAFLKSQRFDIFTRNNPLEFARRQTERFRCASCHNNVEGLVTIETAGGKLRPEWAGQFISGNLPYKPRPWLAARMPAFHGSGIPLAEGLAALNGYPARSPQESDIDAAKADTGAKLVSSAGGFSCVACHAVGTSSGALVVESPGVNLAYSGQRLLKDFYQRWVFNPLAVDPATKMPVYFDENGRSQLLDIYDGNGAQQVEAIWQYLRLGDKMPAPPTP